MSLRGVVSDIRLGIRRQILAIVVVRLVPGQSEQTDQGDGDRHRQNRAGPAHDRGAHPPPTPRPHPAFGSNRPKRLPTVSTAGPRVSAAKTATSIPTPKGTPRAWTKC